MLMTACPMFMAYSKGLNMKAIAFENSKITLTDPYFVNATEKITKNVLSLDPDRFLMGFRENAVCAWNSLSSNKMITFSGEKELYKNKQRYGGWENTLIGGHTFGHYLTALAQMQVNPNVSQTQKKDASEKLEYVINELKKCQEMTAGTKYEGFIFSATLPDPTFRNCIDLQFNNVEKRQGDIFKQAWVPWYAMHKILQGLIDVYKFTGNTDALTVAENLGNWTAKRVNVWDETTRTNALSIEYGGMNDVLYQLYEISKADSKLPAASRDSFLKAAHQFDEVPLFEKVLKNTPNAMDNTHANTTIPKFIGALKRYEVTGEKLYLDYAQAFWTMVTEKHTYITGGNSENEHFGKDNVLAAERTHVNNETCNTYNMLKLSRSLFEITGEKKYADYYENTYLNAIMSSQNPETGCTMYFQPMATGYQKVYTSVDQHFWCCTGTGWENFTKLQDSIYYMSLAGEKSVIVNQYISSKLNADSAELSVECNFLKSGDVKITVNEKSGIDFDLLLRIPAWCEKPECAVKDAVFENGFIRIPKDVLKTLPAGQIYLSFPMKFVAYGLQDDKYTAAFKYGPFVLSAKLGTDSQETGSHGMWVTVAAKKAVDSDVLKVLGHISVDDYLSDIGSSFQRSANLSGQPEWKLCGCDKELVFVPHYRQHKESYGIYWKFEK